MTERKLVPHIRFKGLEEEWETKKLEEFSKIVGGGTPDTNKTDYWNGSINWYSPTEIGKKPYVYSSNKKITELGLKKSSAKIHPANTTILFTSRAGIGDMAILKKPAATNQGFQSIELNDNVSPYFIYSYGFMIKNKAERLASGSTFLEISKRDMKRIALKLPTLKEQQKIGDLFAKLDQLLDLQQQKLDQLELLKKVLLQKLFPKQRAKIPELRFKGFAEEWKKENLSHMAPVRGGFAFSSSNFLKRGIPIIRISNILPEGKTGGEYVYYSKIKNDDSFSLKRGDCVIAMSGATTGKSSIIKDKFDTYYQNQRVGLFQHNENYYYKFVVTLIKSNNFLAQLKRVLIQGAQPNVSASEIDSFIFSIPKEYGEQQKIGNLLAKVDRLIEIENKKFSNLKLVKRSLLQNMFVK